MNRILPIVLAVGLMACAAAIFASRTQATSPAETAASLPVAGAALPERQWTARAAYISREEDGHYWTDADVDGRAVSFLVDTGASVVALTWRDAERLRLKPETLDFAWSIRTANGETKGAAVTLPFVRIGNVRIENVEAMVLPQDALHDSLLGMSFLGALNSYEVRGDTMIIRQ